MNHFLIPASPLSLREPDELCQEQVRAFKGKGFGVSLFSFEEFQMGSFKIFGPIPSGATVVYRGWMVSASEYQTLTELIAAKGGVPLTDPKAYLACHHLPNWYPLIAEFTAETKIFPRDADLPAELSKLSWGKYFIKDYVKSLKTSVGSIISSPEQAQTVIAEMERFRGSIEGGLCVRRFEEYEPDSETRYFVYRGVPHAPKGDIPELVRQCATRIPSPFFSVDVIKRSDGQLRIVEVGDGQVSDVVGWDVDSFAKIWEG